MSIGQGMIGCAYKQAFSGEGTLQVLRDLKSQPQDHARAKCFTCREAATPW